MQPDIASHNTAFAQGVQKQLVKMAKEVMRKSALNYNIVPRIAVDPKRAPEMAALGKRIFALSHDQPNPISGIYHSGLAGYGQLRDLHAHRSQHIVDVRNLRDLLKRMLPGSAEHTAVSNRLSQKLLDFKTTQQQRLAELGTVAQPRERFMKTTLPAAAAAGVGIGAGAAYGNVRGTADTQDSMSRAPLSDRWNYLLHPGMVPPAQSPGSMTSSATDSGSI